MADDGQSVQITAGEKSPAVSSPTVEMYDDLDRAYRFYNEHLFSNQLPHCLITLRARGRTNGYYCRDRFLHQDGRRTAEIALNPEKFGTRTIEGCLSTLVHEQVHLWQDVLDTAPRGAYHNKDFAQRMEAIGLITSHTGRPEGRRTGQRMTHYIDPSGRFLALTRQLLDASFRARWADTWVHSVGAEEWRGWQVQQPGEGENHILDGLSAGLAVDTDERGNAAIIVQTTPDIGPEGDDAAPEPAAAPRPGATAPPMIEVEPAAFQNHTFEKLRSKSKWTCPTCHDNCWGKPTLKLSCMRCGMPLVCAGDAKDQPDSHGEAEG